MAKGRSSQEDYIESSFHSENYGIGDFVPASFPIPHNPIWCDLPAPAIDLYECRYCKSMSADFERNCRNCGAPLVNAQALLP